MLREATESKFDYRRISHRTQSCQEGLVFEEFFFSPSYRYCWPDKRFFFSINITVRRLPQFRVASRAIDSIIPRK